MTVRIGVIGTGLIADLAHLPAYAASDAKLVAVCDVVAARSQAAAQKYGAESFYQDYRELLDRNDIDAVSVCVPNHLHHSITIDALRAGKHVLVEKPMAMNLAQAKEMANVADEEGKILMVGFNNRFRSDVVRVRRLFDEGKLGDVYFAKVGYLRRRGYPSGWFTVKDESGGGPIVDIAIHVMDMTRYMVGSPLPVSVTASVSKRFGACPVYSGVWQSSDVRDGLRDGNQFDVEDFGTAWIRFDNGMVMAVETAWSANVERDRVYSDLMGTKAGASIDSYRSVHKKSQWSDDRDAVRLFTEMSGFEADAALPCRPVDTHLEEIRHFLNVVEGKAEPITTPHDGLVMQALLDAIYESSKKGKEVSISW